jgi:hypothetical protein
MRSSKFKNADATALQNVAIQLWQQSARRANAGRKALSISEMMLADIEFIAAECMAEKANTMLAAPAAEKTDITPAGLIMAAGVALSGFAFMFAPAGNQAAQVFAAASLATFAGLFFLIQKFNF